MFVLVSAISFAQKNNKFKVEYKQTNEVINYVDTLIKVCVSIDNIDIENIKKVYINTSSPEHKTGESYHEVPSQGNVIQNKFNYCLGVFNIAAIGSVIVEVEIEDSAENISKLELDK
jgi:hypothetical protein